MTKEELLSHIKQAMKDKDKVRLSILRQINQAIKQIEVDERRDVQEADLTAAIKKLQKVTTEELDSLKKAASDAHRERIESLSSQLETLKSLLPKQVEGFELEELCARVIDEVKASTKRDMGRVMGKLNDLTNGNFNKPEAAQILGKKLQ